ncbi:MAG: hypothetical protein JWM90_2034 [Thermoleophilia bacterium]|nr:hypothetical protein [Thermoleophilia bacterium]
MNRITKNSSKNAPLIILDRKLGKQLEQLDSQSIRRLRDKVLEVAERAPDSKELKQHARRAQVVAVTSSRKARNSAVQSAQQARDSKLAEAVVAGAGAALPFITSALSKRSTQKHARRAMVVAPIAMRAHPVLAVFAGIGGAVAVSVAARAWMQRRAAEQDAAALEASTVSPEAVSRWEGEGGDPGAAAATPRYMRGGIDGAAFDPNRN